MTFPFKRSYIIYINISQFIAFQNADLDSDPEINGLIRFRIRIANPTRNIFFWMKYPSLALPYFYSFIVVLYLEHK